MHFQNDGDRWYFYCNTDTDGFKITGRQGKNSAILCDASLVQLIKKRTGIEYSDKFLVEEMQVKFNQFQLTQICFHKPLAEKTDTVREDFPLSL